MEAKCKLCENEPVLQSLMHGYWTPPELRGQDTPRQMCSRLLFCFVTSNVCLGICKGFNMLHNLQAAAASFHDQLVRCYRSNMHLYRSCQKYKLNSYSDICLHFSAILVAGSGNTQQIFLKNKKPLRAEQYNLGEHSSYNTVTLLYCTKWFEL